MDMRPTASLIEERLGGKRGNNVVLLSHTTHGFAHQQRVIRGAQGVGMVDRELLLTRAEFGHELLHLDALLLQRGNDVINNPGRGVEPDATITEAAVKG